MPWTPPSPSGPVSGLPSNEISRDDRQKKEDALRTEKRKQAGIGFPSAGAQRHLLITRHNIGRSSASAPADVKAGLRRLCQLFAEIDNGLTKMDKISDTTGKLERVPVRDF